MATKTRKTILTKAAQPGGYTDKNADQPTLHVLACEGLITLKEKLVVYKGIGLAPAPHITITEKGRMVLPHL